jgi:antirestriction protein ArdC
MQNLPVIKNNYRRCAYSLTDDIITLPVITDFDSKEEYYSSLFHEAIHSTGHGKRLDRITIANKKEQYTEEELIAELGSAYLCRMCGISNTVIENQAAYLQGWMSKIKGDPAILIRASLHARAAVQYLLPEDMS